MKKFTTLLFVSMLGGILTLGSYKIFLEEDFLNLNETQQETIVQNPSAGILPVSYDSKIYGTNADFTEAAEKNCSRSGTRKKCSSFWTLQEYMGTSVHGRRR